MRPALKRNIITSKKTGRRYYLGRPSHRPNGGKHYVCSREDCEAQLINETDRFCPEHSQINQSNDVEETNLNDDYSELIDQGTPMEEQPNTGNDEQGDDSMTDDNFNDSIPLSSRQRTKANREIQIDDTTGRRSFRDESGRLRYLCTQPSCTNMLRRQTDQFCRAHSNEDEKKSEPPSSPTVSNEIKDRFRSPFSTPMTTETNGNHAEAYQSPDKPSPQLTGTTRSFRDGSGKIRFLCMNPLCKSRLVRRADTYCKRHLINQNDDNKTPSNLTNSDKEDNQTQQMDVNHNNPTIPSCQMLSQTPIRKRKHQCQLSVPKISNLSIVPANKMVISTTTLLDHQWRDILTFLRQFPDVQLSTNLNVNSSTTHLLVDDSENSLHCTITKKIVQAAVRHHIFIISSRWISECIRSNDFPAEQPYEIQSDSHTRLRSSLMNSPYLFNKSYGFAIECRQCQGSINHNELIELIELTGAKFYEHDQEIDLLIVLCDINEKNLSKIKEKYLQTSLTNIKYVTSDFLLKSIIKFEIQDIDKYCL